MKINGDNNEKLAEVPKTIIEQFLDEFLRAGGPKRVQEKLKSTLLENRNFTLAAVKQALSAEDEK
jgi:hypothetical protein